MILAAKVRISAIADSDGLLLKLSVQIAGMSGSKFFKLSFLTQIIH